MLGLLMSPSFIVNSKGLTMKNKQTFDDWFDNELCRGGIVFWLALIVACLGFYGGLVLIMLIGGQ